MDGNAEKQKGESAAARKRPPTPAGVREFAWTKIAYAATTAWIVLVLVVTRSDPGHPFFSYVFSVPLAAWIGAAVISHIVRSWRRRR